MSPNRPSQPPSRPRVLLADDHPAIRLLYGIWLSAGGYDVDAAADGASALNAVAEHGLPDAAVLDVNMPRVDGLAVCRWLRARSSRLPIVIVSAFDDIEAAALDAGADVVLVKTAEREELYAALDAARSARYAIDATLAEAS
jgi:two-component system, OmpR family, response regulator MprA